MVVRIHGQTKKRAVSLIKKPQQNVKVEPILGRMGSFPAIDIKKNLS